MRNHANAKILIRKPLLYPAELRDQLKNFFSGYVLGTGFRSAYIHGMLIAQRGRESLVDGNHLGLEKKIAAWSVLLSKRKFGPFWNLICIDVASSQRCL
jgi:hypothetical protein